MKIADRRRALVGGLPLGKKHKASAKGDIGPRALFPRIIFAIQCYRYGAVSYIILFFSIENIASGQSQGNLGAKEKLGIEIRAKSMSSLSRELTCRQAVYSVYAILGLSHGIINQYIGE